MYFCTTNNSVSTKQIIIMALTLDGIVPNMGMGSSSGLGVGAGALGGGVAGLLLGGLLANNGNGGLFGGGNNNNNNGANTAVATDILLNPAFQSLQTQIQTTQNQIGANALRDEIGDNQQTINTGFSGLQQDLASIGRDYNNLFGQVNSNISNANFTTLSSINGLGRDITASQNQAALQQLNSFNNLTTTTLQGFNSSAMQVQNATNQIISQGTAAAATNAANFYEISKEMAKCCCEIKGIVSAEGSATRALINDLNVQNLRDQLTAANNKVSNNDQNQYLLSTIIGHLSPNRTVVV